MIPTEKKTGFGKKNLVYQFAELVVYSSEKGRRIPFSSLLFTGKCDRYVSNESGTTLSPFYVKI